MTRGVLRTGLLTLSLLATADTLAAQVAPLVGPAYVNAGRSVRAGARDSATRVTPRRDSLATRTRAEITTRTLVTRVAASGFHVIEVPAPVELGMFATARYMVQPNGVANMLGTLDGTLQSDVRRAVRVTVVVPKDVRAGVVGVGSVQFVAAGSPTVEVPLAIDIAPVRRVQLTLVESLRAVRPGERFTIRYQLINLGNAPDTVTVAAELPSGWRASSGDGRTTLAAGASVQRDVTISVPSSAGRGNMAIQLTARSAGVAVATASALVELVGADGKGSDARTGAVARVAAVTARGPWDGNPLGMLYSVDGAVSDKVQISARAATAPRQDAGASMMLARAGVVQSPASVTLWSNDWRFSAGPVGASLTDLTGTNVGGRGASMALSRGDWSGAALLLRASNGPVPLGTSAFFGQLQRRISNVKVTASASSLRDPVGPMGRQRNLDAISAGAEMSRGRSRIGTEIGYREFDRRGGIGGVVTAALADEKNDLNVRLSRAPGGSRAFARGSSELTVSGSRVLNSRLALNASYWTLGDDAGSGDDLASSGWSLAGNGRLTNWLNYSAGARGFDYALRATHANFGSSDRTAFGMLQLRAGALTTSLDAGIGVRSRAIGGAAIPSVLERSPNSRLASTTSLATSIANLSISAAITDNGRASGFVGRQQEYTASIDDLKLLRLHAVRVTAGGSATRSSSFVTPGAWLNSYRGTLTGTLPFGVAVSVDAEQNPLYLVGTRTSSASPAWLYLARIERSMTLPRFGRGARVEGVVFSDRDGNGSRDRGEGGVAGVVVRRGGEMIVTDRDGRYRFEGESSDAATVDVRSLPMGVVVGRGVGKDFPLVALGQVDVALNVAPSDSSRVSARDMARAVVIARDSVGRSWIASVVRAGLARFDALPPGRYVVEIDFSQAAEPLHAITSRNAFELAPGGDVPALAFVVQPRPLRFVSPRKERPDSIGRGVGETKQQTGGTRQETRQ